MKNRIIILCIGFLLFVNGCATVPTRETFSTYNLNGIEYVSLAQLCQARGINLEYDDLARTAVLRQAAHRVNLMAGEDLILVDASPRHLRHPPQIYQGMLVVPLRFKEEIVDTIFKPTPALAQRPALLAIKKVVIDAGHGGNDPGAISRGGMYEKYITLDISRRLSNLLKEDGVEVVMTRTSDRFVSLPQRVSVANNAGADFFISVHANANRVRSLYGFEVYYAGANSDDNQRAAWAAQHLSLDFDRACFAGNSLTLKTILWDMVYTHNRTASLDMAKAVCNSAARNLDARILGIKGARFYVLRGSRTPAILAEVGFLSNRDEERLLRSSAYRQRIAQALEQGIRNYAQDTYLAQR
jgi:N-acetylmuramoyl-L-alanine amidase